MVFNLGSDDMNLGWMPGFNSFGFGSFNDVAGFLMQKTLWDFSQNNMNRGFNYTAGGALFNFSGSAAAGMPFATSFAPSFGGVTGSSSTSKSDPKTDEEKQQERIDKKLLNDKSKSLKGILDNYLKSLKEKDPYGTYTLKLEDTLSHLPSKPDEKYTKLKELYNEKKTDIQKSIKEDLKKIGYPVTDSSMSSTVNDLKSAMKAPTINSYNCVLSGSSLKSDIDVLQLLSSIGSGGFTKLYEDSYKNASNDKKNSLNILWDAVGDSLKSKAQKALSETGVSEETKTKLQAAVNIEKNSGGHHTRVAMDRMYYWLRIAEAEIAEAKYAALQDDFKGDAVLGKGKIVAQTKTDLQSEQLQYVTKKPTN